ncbi:hypothetical protein FVP23_00045 [Staphylococcus aureus]|nr:hypothetical protein [Staphylococcus aureus]TXO11946.1 hypothetical protein FVP23_00045 [Staphylococcus aureus]
MTERKYACNKLFSILVRGPNKEKLDSQFLQTMQVGVGRRNEFFENIISVPLLYHLCLALKCKLIIDFGGV